MEEENAIIFTQTEKVAAKRPMKEEIKKIKKVANTKKIAERIAAKAAKVAEKELAKKNKITKIYIHDSSMYKVLNWCLNEFPNGLTKKVTKEELEKANNIEKKEMNEIISENDKINSQWTTKIGEGVVYNILKALGENPRRPESLNGYSPDWETDKYIVEVKTRNWTTPGTAGEKVFGTMYKYSDIPNLYGKPLLIICVAYQEWELTFSNNKIFGEVSETKKAFLQLAKSFNIEYMKFSDLFNKLPNDVKEKMLLKPEKIENDI